jgi:hypothetical protein
LLSCVFPPGVFLAVSSCPRPGQAQEELDKQQEDQQKKSKRGIAYFPHFYHLTQELPFFLPNGNQSKKIDKKKTQTKKRSFYDSSREVKN